MDNRQWSGLQTLSLLYVEDEEGIREQICRFLERKVGKLWAAADGEEALALFEAKQPDLVLSDIRLPGIDGLALAELVKKASPQTPVILVTAFNDNDYLLKAIDLGVDAYIVKPIRLEQLGKILIRNADHVLKNKELIASRTMLQAYHEAAEEERRLVGELMETMMHPERLADPKLHYKIQPTEAISGDLVAAARSKNHRLYFMLADSTGHGLPAALNLLTVTHIFYRMAGKGLPVSLLAEEMNLAVNEQSPTDRYVAALLGCVDEDNRTIEIWNGGIPPALLIGASGQILHSFDSANLPLGVLDRSFVALSRVYQWTEPGQLVVYSDGLEDCENEEGIPLGRELLIDMILAVGSENRLEKVLGEARRYVGSRHAFDDLSLMIIECG